MFFLNCMIFISLFIFIPWIWRFRIKPYRAKKSLNAYFSQHPNGKRLKQSEQLLREIFDNIDSYRISTRERKRLQITDDAFIYGEIDFLSFFSILDKVKPQFGEVFYDLGSGVGKAVFATALYTQVSKICGIEYLPALCSMAEAQKAILASNIQKQNLSSYHLKDVQFINDNFIHCDISDGDIIFVNATCLSYSTWETVLAKLQQVKRGTRVIVTTKKIQDEKFKVIFQGMVLMSWGMNSVNIYEKIIA